MTLNPEIIDDASRQVQVAIEGPIAVLTLNRPAKRNALSLKVIGELNAAFEALPASVKAVVLHGNGEHFSAGLDLSELVALSPAEGVMHSRVWYEAFDKIQFGKRPVVCVMHGAVVGGGLELASVAHVRVAEDSAYFGLPEGQRGIFLGGGGSVRVTKLIGFSRVTEMMLTGHVYNAAEGLQLGLAHHLVADGQGLAKARELALRMASNAPMSNFAIMHALPLIAEQPMVHGLMTEALIATITQSEPEARERVEAFLQKRAGKVLPG
ncbi:crotonase/enoyl-CoA hydratase family protein [Rhizobacter sp. Root1221]|uniref:crotonase/enoyl-CoA hydratase family protein n=1 Tax=Rhizobacter sp. Root1221 TaxID=1736433 RepID=UPI000AB25165